MGAGEVDQWLRGLLALPEDLSLILSTHNAAHNICKSRARGTEALLWPPQAPGIRVVCRHTCRQKVHTHKTHFKN